MNTLLFVISSYYIDTPLLTGIGFIFIIIFAIVLVPVIFYLITLQNTLKEVSQENQKMRPGKVWLCLIPLFGTVWNFFVVGYIADSLKLEFNKRNIPVEDRPAYSIGLTYSILSACSYVPFLGGLAELGALVLWIIYWVKINEYKTKLQNSKIQN